MGRASGHDGYEPLDRRARFSRNLRFGAVMFFTPLLVVLVVLLYVTAPLWWNYVAGWLPWP